MNGKKIALAIELREILFLACFVMLVGLGQSYATENSQSENYEVNVGLVGITIPCEVDVLLVAYDLDLQEPKVLQRKSILSNQRAIFHLSTAAFENPRQRHFVICKPPKHTVEFAEIQYLNSYESSTKYGWWYELHFGPATTSIRVEDNSRKPINEAKIARILETKDSIYEYRDSPLQWCLPLVGVDISESDANGLLDISWFPICSTGHLILKHPEHGIGSITIGDGYRRDPTRQESVVLLTGETEILRLEFQDDDLDVEHCVAALNFKEQVDGVNGLQFFFCNSDGVFHGPSEAKDAFVRAVFDPKRRVWIRRFGSTLRHRHAYRIAKLHGKLVDDETGQPLKPRTVIFHAYNGEIGKFDILDFWRAETNPFGQFYIDVPRTHVWLKDWNLPFNPIDTTEIDDQGIELLEVSKQELTRSSQFTTQLQSKECDNFENVVLRTGIRHMVSPADGHVRVHLQELMPIEAFHLTKPLSSRIQIRPKNIPGKPQWSLDSIELLKEKTLHGVVLSPDDKPVQRLSVYWRNDVPGIPWKNRSQTFTSANGEFRFHGLIPGSNHSILVEQQEFPVEITEQDRLEIKCQLPEDLYAKLEVRRTSINTSFKQPKWPEMMDTWEGGWINTAEQPMTNLKPGAINVFYGFGTLTDADADRIKLLERLQSCYSKEELRIVGLYGGLVNFPEEWLMRFIRDHQVAIPIFHIDGSDPKPTAWFPTYQISVVDRDNSWTSISYSDEFARDGDWLYWLRNQLFLLRKPNPAR